MFDQGFIATGDGGGAFSFDLVAFDLHKKRADSFIIIGCRDPNQHFAGFIPVHFEQFVIAIGVEIPCAIEFRFGIV